MKIHSPKAPATQRRQRLSPWPWLSTESSPCHIAAQQLARVGRSCRRVLGIDQCLHQCPRRPSPKRIDCWSAIVNRSLQAADFEPRRKLVPPPGPVLRTGHPTASSSPYSGGGVIVTFQGHSSWGNTSWLSSSGSSKSVWSMTVTSKEAPIEQQRCPRPPTQ